MFFVACSSNNKPKQRQSTSVSKEALIEMNKAKIAEENDRIESMLSRYQWPVSKTETGVYYWIYEKGHGVKVEQGNILYCEYNLKLPNGDEIYNSNTDDALILKIGKSDIPSGLEEVLLLMHQGDKAKIIVPSYLAYGLAGDNNKIPSSATLIYDISIGRVDNNKK